ncbi:MAG: hypothetical protein E7119_06725 [Bacteroidales bacterium]|nr:hypothetical protein [Bacteroidales bacterium]
MAYGDVDVNEDENDNMDVYDAADGTSGKQGFSSSFSNSSIGFQEEEIENDSERLEEREENNERNIDLWGGSRAHAINEINGTIDDYFKMYK